MSKNVERKIEIDFSLSRNKLAPGVLEVVYIMLRIRQPKIELDSKRMPVNTSFVLDRSGSMGGSKLNYTKQAVEFALSHLDFEDMASVVLFNDDVHVLVPHEKVENKDQIIQLIRTIGARGCTNLSGGLLMGTENVKKAMSDDMVNRVILLTDGLANVGICEPEKLADMAKKINNQNITISTMGVGEGFAEDLLVDMAESGNGNFYFIANPEEIPGIFAQELTGLLSVTGQNLRLSIVSGKDCRITGVLGYPISIDGDTVKVSLPDMYNGDSKTILVEVAVHLSKTGFFPVADLHFAYNDVMSELATITHEIAVAIEATDVPESIASGVDLKVVKEVEIFKTAEIKESAMKEADSGNFAGAQQMLDAQENKLQELYSATGDDELKDELDKLMRDKSMMDHRSYDKLTRKDMKMRNYLNRKKR